MARLRLTWISLLAGALVLSSCGEAGRAPLVGSHGSGASLEALAKGKQPFRVAKTYQSRHWAKIERLSHQYAGFPVEKARPNGRHTDPEIVRAFGTEFPASREVLLHYGSGWERNEGTPVLLVHGSILEATSAWIEPHGKEGLAKSLDAAGFRVFAVTFAHRHGDNYLWAEQIANAISRIKAVTGAKQVDVVGHSKGTVAARAYASGLRQGWMSRYQQDIRKLVLIGGPHLGLDYPFRHPVINWGLYPEKKQTIMNAPLSWTKMLILGVWVDTGHLSIFKKDGDYFPGQAQMLYRWDQAYPLPKHEQDWYTTYHGGQGFVSVSPGIDKAIADGGHFIDKLRKKPLDKGIELAVLAGDQATMKNVLNEKTGPSDGVCFVKSATHTEDMTAGGAKLVAKDVLPLNHMELIYAPEAKRWVERALK